MTKRDSKRIKIRYEAQISSDDLQDDIMAWMAKPENNRLQTINNFTVNHEPTDEYQDDQQNKVLFFEFKKTSKVNLQTETDVTLWQEDAPALNVVNSKEVNIDGLDNYLKDEPFLEQTKEIRKKTSEVTKGSHGTTEKAHLIYEFVKRNFQYDYPVKKRGVKNLDLDDLRGDCGEYSALFVTMCRIAGIPAVNRTGYSVYPKQKSIQEHGWASVYLSPYGWLDVDAQYAAQEEQENAYFLERSDYRFTLVSGFNIPLKPPIPDNYLTDFWAEAGLPFTHTHAQILQPLACASKNKIRFKEKIYLKNPLT